MRVTRMGTRNGPPRQPCRRAGRSAAEEHGEWCESRARRRLWLPQPEDWTALEPSITSSQTESLEASMKINRRVHAGYLGENWPNPTFSMDERPWERGTQIPGGADPVRYRLAIVCIFACSASPLAAVWPMKRPLQALIIFHVPSAPCLGSMPSNSECMAIPGYCRGVELDWAVQEYQNDGTPRLGSPWCGTEKCNACREECHGITICKCNCAAMYGVRRMLQKEPCKLHTASSCKNRQDARSGHHWVSSPCPGHAIWPQRLEERGDVSPSRRPGWWACRSLKTPSQSLVWMACRLPDHVGFWYLPETCRCLVY